MSSPMRISRSAAEMLLHPAAPGKRHIEIVKLAVSLSKSGLNREAIFHQLRPNYGYDLTDKEINLAIEWAMTRVSGKNVINRGLHFTTRNRGGIWLHSNENPSRKGFTDPISAISRYLGQFRCTVEDLFEKSPIRPGETFESDALLLISSLFNPGEFVNVVSAFSVNSGKASPFGYGITGIKEYWISKIEKSGIPASDSGVWIRPNPTNGKGISDVHIHSFRHLLLEFDTIPSELQLAFIVRLPLPISAIITSGGKSIHAWVKVDAIAASDFRRTAERIYAILAPFGIDLANKNPSRLSRLPGTVRKIGGVGDGRQRLLYLNQNPAWESILS